MEAKMRRAVAESEAMKAIDGQDQAMEDDMQYAEAIMRCAVAEREATNAQMNSTAAWHEANEAKMRFAVAEKRYLDAQERTKKASMEAALASKDVENRRDETDRLEEQLENSFQMCQQVAQFMLDRGQKPSPEMQAVLLQVLKELETSEDTTSLEMKVLCRDLLKKV
tara:strand:- start:16873 stop:17373 length:501 start_codon:yes stop_codon:yes gene_type:complete